MSKTISIQLSDELGSEVIDAICANGNYKPKLADNSDNPVSKQDFVVGTIKTFLKSHVLTYRREADVDLKAARTAFAGASDAVAAAIRVASERRDPVSDDFANVSIS